MRIQNNLIRRLQSKVLILAVTALTTPFSALGQDARITLPASTLTPSQVIEAIHAQTDYMVIVNNSRISDGISVKISRSPVAVSEVLDRMLVGSGYTYMVDGKVIFLPVTANEVKKSGNVVTQVAVRTVAGSVKGASGEQPLENVTVEILGVAGGKTQTDMFGRFSVADVPSGNYVVRLTSADGSVIRFREVAVPASGDIDVSLVMSEEVLAVSVAAAVSDAPSQAVKTTAYFVPNAVDNTIRAFSDEPKTEYSFTPASQIGSRMYLPKAAVKINLLYLGTTTPNIAVEFGLAKKWTLDIVGGINVWNLNERKGGIRHWLIQPEVRYWFCQRFEKHFIGLHGIGGQYQISDIDLAPLGNDLTGIRYDGWAAGAGISYGYHLPMGKRWAWEFTVGAGYIYLDYNKYNCGECDNKIGHETKHYFGPTKAGVSLIFMIR